MKKIIAIGAFILGCTPSVISNTQSTIVPNVAYGVVTHVEKQAAVNVVAPLVVNENNFRCLAKNIYYEAGSESWLGKIAVAQVTYLRKKNGKWGDTFCDVVYAKNQFSWTQNKKKIQMIPSGILWEESKKAAIDFINGHRIKDLIADHYHADYILPPKWTSKMQKQIKIGQHIFYASVKDAKQKT